jgi:DNA-binding GntR family transcriptional regulator
MKFLQRAYGQFYWERQRSIISLKHPERHDRILQAMRSRDLEQAKDCLREDIVAFTLF